MELSEALREQARTLIDVILNGAVRYIEEQPLGSYLPIWKLNQALAGIGASLNLKAIGDRMRERNCTRAYYVVKGPGGSPSGLLIIDAEAGHIIAANQNNRGARPRQERPATAPGAAS